MEGVRFFGEADAIIPHAEAKFFRLSLEPLDVAAAGFGKAMECREDAHGRFAVQTADVGAGRFGEDDSLHLDSVEVLRS